MKYEVAVEVADRARSARGQVHTSDVVAEAGAGQIDLDAGQFVDCRQRRRPVELRRERHRDVATGVEQRHVLKAPLELFVTGYGVQGLAPGVKHRHVEDVVLDRHDHQAGRRTAEALLKRAQIPLQIIDVVFDAVFAASDQAGLEQDILTSVALTRVVLKDPRRAEGVDQRILERLVGVENVGVLQDAHVGIVAGLLHVDEQLL